MYNLILKIEYFILFYMIFSCFEIRFTLYEYEFEKTKPIQTAGHRKQDTEYSINLKKQTQF
jgi:hypothetical protein